MPVQVENVPQELKEVPQWVIWKYEERNGKLTKVPYSAESQKAKVNSRDTWLSFQEALASLSKQFAGIGFVLSGDDPFVAVDIDHCIDNNHISAEAQRVITSLNGYTEITPSGRGIRIIVKGKLPPGSRRTSNIEIYDTLRYVTITGNVLPGSVLDIPERQKELSELYENIFGKIAKIAREIVDGKHGKRLKELFEGYGENHYDYDESRADQAFCRLAAQLGLNADEVDKLFRRSARYRAKWDEVHSGDGKTYGEMTIGKIFTNEESKDVKKSGFMLIPLDDIKPKEPQFLLYPWLPRGALTFLDGDPGGGKTWLLMALCACLSANFPMPPLTPPQMEVDPITNSIIYSALTDLGERKAKILLITYEDEPEILRARLSCLTQEKTEVYIIGLPGFDSTGVDGANLEEVEEIITQERPDLIIVDPITLYLSGFENIDTSSAVQTRRALKGLMALAKNINSAVLCTRHFRKTTGKALYRGIGSVDFTASARSVLTLVHNEKTGIISVAHTKHNYSEKAPTVTFTISRQQRSYSFTWEGVTDSTADELIDPEAQDAKAKLDDASAFLSDYLSSGAATYTEIAAEAKQYSITPWYLNQAAKQLKVVRKHTSTNGKGRPKIVWELPKPKT